MLAAAVERVRVEGLALDFANVNLEDLIRSSAVPRSTVFRIWPNRGAFIGDLIRAIFEDDAGFEAGFDEATQDVVVGVVQGRQAEMSTIEGRRRVLREASRQALLHNVAAVERSAAWRTYKTALAAVVSSKESFGGDDIRDVLRQIELRFLDRMHDVYALFNELFHRQMRLGVSERDLAILIASIVEGIADRRQLIPEHINRLRLTPVEGEEPHEWHLAALSVYGVYVTMTEDIDEAAG